MLLKIPTSPLAKIGTVLLLALTVTGCRVASLGAEQDKVARRLLSTLNAGNAQAIQSVHMSGTPDLHEFQPLPDFTRTVNQLRQRVGPIETVTKTDVRITRTMSAEKTSLIYHLAGHRGQADVKVYLTRQRDHWVLDGLRLGDTP